MNFFLRLVVCVASMAASPAWGEAMLQYFNTTWKEIERKMPELAEAGYESLWLPPPTKASGGLSVGYDLWDRFDLGSKDQRSTIATRYGTEADLQQMIRTAHRFGIRVYFDNIMNHNAFDIPGFNESTPISTYPGFVPEDFHLRLTEDGFYRKWDNTRSWGDAWQVMNLGLSDLIDIAQEPGEWNLNFGRNEGDRIRKIRFLRHPLNPEYYCYKPTAPGQRHSNGDGQYVGFGAGNSITPAFLAANADFYSELVEDFLHRAVRWKMDRTRADGLRLDAVKHVRDDFFGATGAGKNSNNYGYTGQAQAQFNLSRGFSDWSDHRDTVFDTEKSRNDAMMFGEHLGQPPGYSGYIDRGMRLVDNDLRSNFNNLLGNPSSGLQGYDQSGSGGFPADIAVTHAQSHDSDFAARRELQHAFYFTRAGLPLVYTDGNYQAETLSQSGGAFPRHANTAFLGQFGDGRLPNLMQMHQNFARGTQKGAYGGSPDLVAYERIDRRQDASNDAAGAVALVMLNDNFANGIGQTFSTSFPPGAYLYQYARGAAAAGDSMQPFFITLGDAGGGRGLVSNSLLVPRGGYYLFSWKNPDPAPAWKDVGGSAIQIYQNGNSPVGMLAVERKDGPDGDPAFNPYNLPDADATDYTYRMQVPRVTNGSNLKFVVRADGSTENVLFKLNGGIDLNGTGSDAAKRDHPPGSSTDVFLGYENATAWSRFYGEKFAAKDTLRNKFGSAGAETYQKTIGSPGFIIANGPAAANSYDNEGGDVASFIYHDPESQVNGTPPGGWPGGTPAMQYAENASTIQLWAKPNGVGLGFRMFCYFTTDGSNPEGAIGEGVGSTQVVEMNFSHQESPDDWWTTASIPKPASGVIKYKIGIVKGNANSWFPGNASAVSKIGRMTSRFEVSGLDATTIEHFPHNDFARTQNSAANYGDWLLEKETGLEEGFHVMRARAFIKRIGNLNPTQNGAPIYQTLTQTFYYDTLRPSGEIVFPSAGETLNQQSYEAVVRTDRTVDEVWIHLADSDPANNDSQTRVLNGNGIGFEPFTDTNRNGLREPSEAYEDLNQNGSWDNNLTESWVKATPVQPNPFVSSSFPKEWRFSFRNIPASGTAEIKVRLKEVSSSPLQSLSDASGHYTTLTRTVNTAGPATRLFVAYPQADAEQVGDDYVLKAFFSKSLGEGVSDAQLISEFLVQIGSSVSGTPTNAVAQSRSLYSIVRNETPDYHALAFTIPSLYNGDPDFLHHIGITHTRASATLNASRVVRAAVSSKPFLSITNPPAVGSDGRPHEVVLPAIASPSPDDRAMTVRVDTDLRAEQVNLTALQGMGTITSLGMQVSGNSKIWQFRWSGLVPGRDRLLATAALSVGGPVSSSMEREVSIVLRQTVAENPTDGDDDDDGIPDSDETTRLDLPSSNSETWSNGQIHFWRITGRTNPVTPDSDDDLVPDGLEVGIASNFIADTDITTDTDGDGFKNFIADVDPPVFNTTDNSSHPRYDFNRGRTDQIGGSMTDPTKPDSDDDNQLDKAEDANRNGRVDIALLDAGGVATSIIASPVTVYNTSQVERSSIPSNGVFLETDPNNSDTDADGAPDGAEDPNGNGRVDMQLVTSASATPLSFDISLPANAPYLIGSNLANQRSRAIHRTALAAAFPVNGYPRLLWAETDPLNGDTDGDGLPDQWEVTHGLDPLVSATVNLRTGGLGILAESSGGDPDGDGFTNLQEFTNGTKPKVADTVNPPSANSIVIGPKDNITFGKAINEQAFTDWTREDLISFDESEGSGSNNQGGDTFLAFDGFDSSRDLVAFYARDGGADGYYYFRVDLHDLRAQAEQGNLDIYVVMDSGNALAGEAALPDDVDIRTEMRWEAIVACYQTNQGRVFVDTNLTVNSNSMNQALTGANGVVVRDQNSPNGFGAAYFNHELDAVEFSIKRQALLDAGWNGTSRLNFQVFTTRDGTNNTGANGPGLGDIAGRNDLRDTITDDYLSEDFFSNQANIASNGVLSNSLRVDGSGLYPDQRKSAKMMLLTHGHQPILPAAETQRLINSGFTTGYHRAIDAHQAFAQPLTLHLTPTLASAMQWAAVDPAVNRPWRDGPSFVQRLGDEMRAGRIDLLGTTFSDHIVRYFDHAFNQDNRNLAADTLNHLLGQAPSASVFWNPERVADELAFQRIAGMGYSHTFIDQMRHLFKWQGRDTALSDDGYRINRYHGVNCFVINDQASSYRNQNLDSGFPMPWRNLFLRKARSGNQQQVVVIQNWWEELSNTSVAAAYDRNLRWAANRPWIQVVTPDQIATGQVDTNRNLIGDAWSVVDRGSPALDIVSQDWIDHATQENYDHWYFGQAGREEGLSNKRFEIRAGVLLPAANTFGHQAANDGKLADLTFDAVAALNGSNGTRSPRHLARATIHSSVLLTAFHEQSDSDLTKYSTGLYINPDTSSQSLAILSTRHQSQIRYAAIYQEVAAWAQNPPAATQALALDVDLDGEQEYLLRNDRVMALFEAIGGRMTASWARDPENGSIYQLSGNFLAQADGANELEGTIHHDGLGNTGAKRTSSFKDWFAHGVNQSSVNGLYTVTPAGSNGWNFTSANGNISKTISLSNMSSRLHAQYALSGGVTQLSVRFGLSPHLENLVSSGQRHLFSPPAATGTKTISYQKNEISVSASIHTNGLGLSGSALQEAAIDDAPTAVPSFDSDALPRRNQAFTEQVELLGSGPTFSFALELISNNNDADQDGLPDDWETLHSLATDDAGSGNIINGPNGDPDLDGVSNGKEWLLGMNPRLDDLSLHPSLRIERIPTGVRLSFPTIANRVYQLESSETLQSWSPVGTPLTTAKNALPSQFQLDDSTTQPRKFFRMTVRPPYEP